MERLVNIAFQKIDVEFLKGMFKSHFKKMDAKKFFKEHIEEDLKTIKRIHEKYANSKMPYSRDYDELKRQAKTGSTLYIDEKIAEAKESMSEEEKRNTIWNTLDMDILYELFIREVGSWK
ncbi:MAG TPA: hypothetical protein VM577_03080 [Anaerovoracaceae bacterium]|nr:hypothetical protein [Anaerovoracaceae bacterium]